MYEVTKLIYVSFSKRGYYQVAPNRQRHNLQHAKKDEGLTMLCTYVPEGYRKSLVYLWAALALNDHIAPPPIIHCVRSATLLHCLAHAYYAAQSEPARQHLT